MIAIIDYYTINMMNTFLSGMTRSVDIKEFIRKATHPHPCPLPSRERGLKNRPSLEGRG